jgi:ArsR family transcriptional regulator, arsenate/arsenite/antimonite-responsive transcriptional repressor
MGGLCNEMKKFGKGIGNASRYQIVEALLKGRKTVGELVKIVGISQPAVSQHLKTLKASNIVIAERRGQEVFYAINTDYVLALLKSLAAELQKQKRKELRKHGPNNKN